METSQAEVVLNALSEVYDTSDVQLMVERICRRVAQMSPYRLVLISLYFGEDVYIGLEGGDETLRESFLRLARNIDPEERERKRNQIWSRYRIPGTNICFIPEGSDVRFSASFKASEEVPGAEWRPEDRLMVFVRGMDGNIHGVLSLDRPSDGKRPDPDNLGPLAAIDRFITLMGVIIHNQHLAAKLRDSEARYAAVVEQGHDAIMIEREGEIVFANRRLAEMLGVRPPALVGRRVDEILEKHARGALPGEQEGRLRGKDGQPIDVSIRSGTIRFGESTATLVAAADITERKRLLTHLVRAQKMESVGTLASGIAHDFNNLLGGILGFASLLKGHLARDSVGARYVENIEKAADRAADVTRQLLGIVRGEEVRVTTFPPSHVIGEVASLLEETLDPRIDVVVRCESDLPLVMGDESQIHQVLLNVCLNARDAMPGGGTLTLEASRATRGSGAEWVRLAVHDTGFGMDLGTLSKVFDPFYTTKQKGRGTGLGLYMAYRVIERHGGTIDLTSRPGQGTTVEILLPSGSAARRGHGAPDEEESFDEGGTILLVDDEELIRGVAGEMLAGLGYEVVTAADGREAIDKVRAEPGRYRCVILDIAMPVLSGWEAASALREIRDDLPILFSSGHDVNAAQGNTHGFDGARCLKKPYRIEDLRRALIEVLHPAASSR